MKLPPLHALRVFDAVASLGGVRVAAQALFVTPGAVTQQLRALEEYFGLALIERHGRGIALTEAGRTLHANTLRPLRAIAAAAESLRLQPARIRITAAPSVAVRWLVPRLKSFSRAHPEIEMMVDANAHLVDLRAGGWDLALREGAGVYPGHRSELLFTLDVMPVASPSYARRELRSLRTRWQRARLLHDAGNTWWQRWLEMVDSHPAGDRHDLYFSNNTMAIAAAVDGQGVALVAPSLIQQELAQGTLVVLDQRTLVTGTGVHALWPAQDDLPSGAAGLFRQWLLDEAAAQRAGASASPLPAPHLPRRHARP